MRLRQFFILILILAPKFAFAAEPCQVIHGRAHYYFGDGQFRIWHIGTHHEFGAPYAESHAPYGETDEYDPSWDKIAKLLQSDIKKPEDISDNDLFADFVVCPIEPYRKGSVQYATVRNIFHPRLVKRSH